MLVALGLEIGQRLVIWIWFWLLGRGAAMRIRLERLKPTVPLV